MRTASTVVELSALREPALVLPTIAQALRVGEQPGEPLAQTLAAWAADRELLLVVDNFEQVAEAGLDLLRLIEASPRLTVVVTSRRVLHLSGEHVFPSSLSPRKTPPTCSLPAPRP